MLEQGTSTGSPSACLVHAGGDAPAAGQPLTVQLCRPAGRRLLETFTGLHAVRVYCRHGKESPRWPQRTRRHSQAALRPACSRPLPQQPPKQHSSTTITSSSSSSSSRTCLSKWVVSCSCDLVGDGQPRRGRSAKCRVSGLICQAWHDPASCLHHEHHEMICFMRRHHLLAAGGADHPRRGLRRRRAAAAEPQAQQQASLQVSCASARWTMAPTTASHLVCMCCCHIHALQLW
jgi:hypothetical protein